MSDDTPRNEPAAEPAAAANGAPTDGANASNDTPMADAPAADQPASSPAPAVQASSPAPGRTGTPAHGSRAASAHPDPGPSIPSEAAPHGDSTRRYLNTKITGVLLDGMKHIAKEKPSDPLRVLGEFLIKKSKAYEEPPSGVSI